MILVVALHMIFYLSLGSDYHERRSTVPRERRVASKNCLPIKDAPRQPFRGLSILEDDWETSQLVSNIPLILLRERLGFQDAELKPPPSDFSYEHVFQHVAEGNAHMAFEVWPFGSQARYEEHAHAVTNYTFLHISHGVYSLADRPEVELQQSLSTPEGVARFSQVTFEEGSASARQMCVTDPRFDCDADGIWRPSACRKKGANCTAQLLHFRPGAFNKTYENMIEELGIPLSIAYVGQRAIAEASWWAAKDHSKQDLLFVWYNPSMRFNSMDFNHHFRFVHHRIRSEFGKYHMPDVLESTERLHKVFWPDLRSAAPDAFALFNAFELSRGDLDQLVLDYRRSDDAWSASCAWLLRNPVIWESWIQFPSRPDNPYRLYNFHLICFTADSCLEAYPNPEYAKLASVAWWCGLLQAIFGIIMYILSFHAGSRFVGRCGNLFKWRLSVEKTVETLAEISSDISHIVEKVNVPENTHQKKPGPKDEFKQHRSWRKKDPLHYPGRASLFCGHVRTYENFARSNLDVQLVKPPGSPLEVEGLYSSRLVRYFLLWSCPELRETLAFSCACALWCGAGGSFLFTLELYQISQDAMWGQTSASVYESIIKPIADGGDSICDDFKFFPIFAVLGLLGFFQSRWRNFFFAAWRVEGRLKDMSIIVGSSIGNHEDVNAKQLMFRVYRYMVAAMAMNYKNYVPELKCEDPVGQLVALGLLTEDEEAVLKPSGTRVRDNLLTWIGVEAMNGFRNGTLHGLAETSFMDNLNQTRANMMFFHGNNFYPVSNIWTSLVQFAVDLWVVLLCWLAPFKQYAPADVSMGYWGCLQPWISLSIFPIMFTFLGALHICTVLQRPFAGPIDTLNIDALISGTEETLFANLRAGFHLHESQCASTKVASGLNDHNSQQCSPSSDANDLKAYESKESLCSPPALKAQDTETIQTQPGLQL